MLYEEARPVIVAYDAKIPAEQWREWVTQQDRVTRQRLDQGEEDSLSNLLRFGVSFTNEYRIDDEYLPKFGASTLVNAFAENRANDLIRALASPQANEGIREMRGFVGKKGYSTRTAAEQIRLKAYLLANLGRLRDDFLKAHSEEAKRNRSHAFETRGISLDTNLWPDYDVDVQLRKMKDGGLLRSGGIRRLAIVGPGLDFVNKVEGLDYYPPQCIQPFAVIDSLVRIGLADAASLELYTFDISSRVNLHLAEARKQAAAGSPYTLQLPWFAGGRWTDAVRRSFTEYWNRLGGQIGSASKPLPVPESLDGIDTRAVQIRPAIVARIFPVDLNVVYARVNPAGFDLIIATNIFVYYSEFEQSLARLNLAAMLAPGGYLLSNDRLAERIPDRLKLVGTTEIPLTGEPVITESIFTYQRH